MEVFLAMDTETTGTDPDVHGILTGYFVEARLRGRKLIANEDNSLDLSIKYTEIDMPKIEPKALQVNGIDMSTFVGSHTPVDAVRSIIELKQKIKPNGNIMVFGHNVTFDIAFLKKLFDSVGQTWSDHFHYHYMDSMHVANALRFYQMFDSNVRLVDLVAMFGIDIQNSGTAHEAKYDTLAAIDVMNGLSGFFGGVDRFI